MLTKQDLELRAKLWNDVNDKIRSFFRSRQFIEVQTPIVVKSPGMEPNLSPLATDVHTDGPNAHSTRMGLITSPEYSMKKLLGGGMEKIFTLVPVFRDRELPGQRWGIEFTMLEWYCQGADYRTLMQETGELINFVLDRADEWQMISYVEEFKRVVGFIPLDESRADLIVACSRFGIDAPHDDEATHEIIDRLFYAVVWPTVIRSERYFLCEFPIPCASLSKVGPTGMYAERFEAFVGELEMCNGFTELTDVSEQRRRFMIEAEERRLAKKEVFPIDEELLAALEFVSSNTYGNALGVDRLVMLYAGANDIDSVHLFPPSTRY